LTRAMQKAVETNLPVAGVASLAFATAVVPSTPIYEERLVPDYTAGIQMSWSNVVTAIEIVSGPALRGIAVDAYEPRTELGKRLLELRRSHVSGGGRLLDWSEIDAEVRERRGGLPDG